MQTIHAYVAVACTNSSGEADMPVFDFTLLERDYQLGVHYDMAKDMAAEDGYESPFVCFDQSEASVLKRAYDEIEVANQKPTETPPTHQPEVLPGAVASEIYEILMQDLVGDYEVPEQVPEWSWVEEQASFENRSNGEYGVWEFIVNIECLRDTEIPERLKATVAHACATGASYLLFHQGT